VREVMCVMLGGEDRIIRDARGKVWRFEDHPHSGPIALTPKTGEIATNQPSEDSPFWPAVQAWYDMGKEIGPDGYCVWKPKVEPTLKLRHLGGRHWEIIDEEVAIPETKGASE